VALLCAGCASAIPSDQGAARPSATREAPVPVRSSHPDPAEGECAPPGCADVVLTGDLLVHPQLWDQAADDAAVTGRLPLDFEPLLAGQRPYLEAGDLAVCHLETTVAEPGGPYAGYPAFNVPPQILTAAADVGYRACTSASNHTLDYGTPGVLRTLKALDAAGLAHTGSYATEADARQVLLLETPSATVAVIEATYGLNEQVPDQPWRVDLIDVPAMVAKAEAARELGADIVIAGIHAGDEYASVPNAQQTETAHALADSGAVDFIYGHHTHSVLPLEKHNGTWIAYGLGNAVTELSPVYDVNNEGLMLRARFSRGAGGAWSVGDLAWLPSVIVSNPYRWCSLAPDRPAGSCSTAGHEQAVRERTRAVVESLGAAEDGAHQWDLTAERPAG
jgi:poly-gamma-glutamate synthesis protein (capsule biosynthesis protein)